MRKGLLLLSIALVVSCGDDDLAQKGAEGGECRISLDPCDPGLVCDNGSCEEATGDNEVHRLRLEVPIIATELAADGKAATAIRFKVTDVDAGEPYQGEIRLWVEPAGAGVLKNGLIELDEDGLGLTEFSACNGRNRDCPAFVNIRFAVQNDPSDWFGSRTIRLIGGNNYDTVREPDTDPGGTVTDPDPTSFGPAIPAACPMGNAGVYSLSINGTTSEWRGVPVRYEDEPNSTDIIGEEWDTRSASSDGDDNNVSMVFGMENRDATSDVKGLLPEVKGGTYLPTGRFNQNHPIAIIIRQPGLANGAECKVVVINKSVGSGDTIDAGSSGERPDASKLREAVAFTGTTTRMCDGVSTTFSASGCYSFE